MKVCVLTFHYDSKHYPGIAVPEIMVFKSRESMLDAARKHMHVNQFPEREKYFHSLDVYGETRVMETETKYFIQSFIEVQD